MGADLYIKSITDKAKAEYQPYFDKAVKVRDSLPKDTEASETAQELVTYFYDRMYPDEGYFRDSYNATSLLATLGLSWWQDVGKMLNSKGNLKGHKLAQFRDMVAEASQNLPDKDTLAKNGAKLDEGDNSVDAWHKYFQEKRQRLLNFLDHAIDLKEPVYCSI